ncbi:MAG TPA: NifB/NifX family molybdenum-iron cluster-binding protein [Caldisericia bacterium]|nr:NifB/NifX family molybdenum-iron cluster-binding protein [Caldisericia bacterium]HPF49799.1 NifB/NifX family molybdenum-iron cluster-binding protein [Caldisericia bacterium]HPI84656.1 NifB/NifX family molybdenum-iron cluster-binding protein [Caldisericia bacterium]HPQ93898.1 NifB/NifX family molybdenum-iron cluster-binding protein [Caldisericia bacterium]HRV75679.1 NifB/NifX family molybdenum-iron cluster-binding protein [Caldisericia bacterium]
MKIAFPTEGDSMNSNLCEHFGRAPKFLILNTENDSHRLIDNTHNTKMPSGAGIKTAEMIANDGVTHVVAKNCGPKAKEVLELSSIKVVLTDAETLEQAKDAVTG